MSLASERVGGVVERYAKDLSYEGEALKLLIGLLRARCSHHLILVKPEIGSSQLGAAGFLLLTSW